MSQQIYKANGLHTPLWSGLHSGLWSPFSGSALAGGGVGPSGDPGDTLLTEAGDDRLTEAGDFRLTEGG